MTIEERYRQQVDLLVRVLPSVAKESVFALKGGTAINLFVQNLPRLSVDIDLTFLPVKTRKGSLADIDAALRRISKNISEALPETRITPSRLHKEGIINRLIVKTPKTQIKVEVTPVMRGCLFESKVMQVAPFVESQFGFAEISVVSFDDLYAGKLVAALDRQHPRDLFDICELLRNEDISMSLRQAFLAYILSHNRPAVELLVPKRKDIRTDFEENFLGMTMKPITLKQLVATREEMIDIMVTKMPEKHRSFLIGVERGDIDWSLSGLPDIARLPAVRWKLKNLDRLDADRRQMQAEKLEGVWKKQTEEMEGVWKMTDTVFWSWQDDLPAKENRVFIREALAIAVDRVNETLDVEDADRVALDHGTKSTPGMADISQTILDKISSSAVMVADVTPIAESEGGKALPNPNVMVELGYGMGVIGWERIVAVLNTGNGDTIENLPFDIRHRRILTYELSAGATKAERKLAREKLIKELAEAIRVDINQDRETRLDAEPIEGVESDPNSPGLWKADWPVIYTNNQGDRGRVIPRKLPRAWLRIIPEGFPNGKPPITALEKLPDQARLQAPNRSASSGDFGTCPFGFLTYWATGEKKAGTCIVRNLAAYLDKNGEVWMSNGSAFIKIDGKKGIDLHNLFSNWIKGLESGMVCLDELGASPRRRIVLGIDGMMGVAWTKKTNYLPATSRKPELWVEETRRDWSVEQRKLIVRNALDDLHDAFSIEPVSDEEFEQFYNARRNWFDS